MTQQKLTLKENKKGQFLARDYIIALIVFTGLISLMVLMVSGMASEYDKEGIVDDSIVKNYGFLDNTTKIAGDAFDASTQKDGLSFIGTVDVLFSSAFTIFALIFGSIGLVGGAMTQFTVDFGVPTAVANIIFPMLLAILTTILVFVIISTTTRRDF